MSLPPVIREVEALLEHILTPPFRVRVNMAGDLCSIAGDKTQLSQALMNLCVNARDAMIDGGDVVIEDPVGAPGGSDTVKSTVDFSLATLGNVEKVTLIGSDTVDATGNGLANVLTGNDANNRLDGGSGKDTMIGGKGGDIYIVDNAGDVVTETFANSKGGGIEHIQLNNTDPWTEVDGERSSLKTKHPILSDFEVRRALALLVDKDSVEKNIYGRGGVATKAP